MKSAEKATMTMTCESCEVSCQRFGIHRNGLRRFRCPQCGKTYTEAHKPALDGSYISQEHIVLALRLMVEGNSLRSTERITGLDINTLMKILLKAGENRIHKTLRVTPAMESGITNRVWEIADLLA